MKDVQTAQFRELKSDFRGLDARVLVLEMNRPHPRQRMHSGEQDEFESELTPAGGIRLEQTNWTLLKSKMDELEKKAVRAEIAREVADKALMDAAIREENKQKETDRFLKRMGIAGSAVVTLVGALVYAFTHFAHL